MTVRAGTMLRPAPPKSEWATTRLGRFLGAVEQDRNVTFATYEDAWRWSVDNLPDFWSAFTAEFDVLFHSAPTEILRSRRMPGAEWFPGATLNYTEHIVREWSARTQDVAILSRSQTAGRTEWTGGRLLDEIGRIQRGLIKLGVEQGDRVAGYLPNIPQAVAAHLAAAGLGAVWCSVPPEMGTTATLDRIAQLQPSVVIAVDGYRWGAKPIDRESEISAMREALPDARFVLVPYLNDSVATPVGVVSYADFTAEAGEVIAEPVPFAHPLAVLFSSGTTGRPKAIVHCHGGIVLEHLKSLALQQDLGADDIGFYFTTTGWMVWNLMVSCLLVGTAVVVFDGDPSWPAPDGEWSQWAIAEETGASFLGTSAGYLAASARSGLRPAERWDLRRLRVVQSSGSPLAADVHAWVYDAVAPDALVAPTSGGTDICSGFVGGAPLVAVYAGEMSCRPLGVDVEALDRHGDPVTNSPGELVARQPIPSMPVFFWGDDDFERYRSTYFDVYPGMWRHGDWLIHTERDSWIITGRSDATLNRGGVRLGTAEFYAVLDSMPEIADSVVVHVEDASVLGSLVLAIVPAEGHGESDLEKLVRTALRAQLSPRHSPDHVVVVPSVPRNKNGKRLEIPLKRIVQGQEISDVLDLEVVMEPDDVTETVHKIRSVLYAAAAGRTAS